MNLFDKIGIQAGRGICYSGFREGQQPEVSILVMRKLRKTCFYCIRIGNTCAC
jgi:hypothetical protein